VEDYYAILGLDRGASKESIRVAFRRRAREVHPDFQLGSNENEKALQSRQMAQLNEAYEVLHDAERRRVYDEQLRMHAVLTSKQTTVATDRSRSTGTQATQRIRTRPEVDSSLVCEFSDQLRANFHTKCKGFSWKDREMEGFDWALESSSWSSHSWVVLRALASVHSGSVKSFLTYADAAMTRHHSGLRRSYFLFLLAFQQMRDWDAISLQCRGFVTSETRPGSSAGHAGMILLDVQHGRVLRFEAQTQGKLHEMIDWVAANI
jgi:curved DNA-binding protein CbpA